MSAWVSRVFMPALQDVHLEKERILSTYIKGKQFTDPDSCCSRTIIDTFNHDGVEWVTYFTGDKVYCNRLDDFKLDYPLLAPKFKKGDILTDGTDESAVYIVTENADQVVRLGVGNLGFYDCSIIGYGSIEFYELKLGKKLIKKSSKDVAGLIAIKLLVNALR
jgi:hypothetical protein